MSDDLAFFELNVAPLLAVKWSKRERM